MSEAAAQRNADAQLDAGATFFAVVRAVQAAACADGAVPIGHQGPPAREALRLRPALDLSFGPDELAQRSVDAATGRVELVCRFLGLYGTGSPLPACYTELLLYEDPEGRLRAFLDVFNHRLLSLLYRAFEKYRHLVQFDGRGVDEQSRRMRLLCHVERDSDPLSLLAHAGLLHQQPLSEASLERILRAELGVPVEVHSCRVRWIAVPSHRRTALGRANCELGGTAPLGDSMRSAATTFGIELGPLSLDDYLAFLPDGARRGELRDLVQRLDRDLLDCEVSVAIRDDEVEPTALGAAGGLGWTTWLGADARGCAAARGATTTRSLLEAS